MCLTLPIKQSTSEVSRAMKHIEFLKKEFGTKISHLDIDLTRTYETLLSVVPMHDLADVNTRSRLRMTTIYHFANTLGYLVAGTGNKVEDYGIGFFTKFGDGGVDISPIGDLMKSEVYALGRHMGVIEEILQAKPTDGLWTDGRTDEDQIGATYDELEWAMNCCDGNKYTNCDDVFIMRGNFMYSWDLLNFSAREKEVLKIYLKRHNGSQHKMNMPPVCKLK
jgi:NAD+ synthase